MSNHPNQVETIFHYSGVDGGRNLANSLLRHATKVGVRARVIGPGEKVNVGDSNVTIATGNLAFGVRGDLEKLIEFYAGLREAEEGSEMLPAPNHVRLG